MMNVLADLEDNIRKDVQVSPIFNKNLLSITRIPIGRFLLIGVGPDIYILCYQD